MAYGRPPLDRAVARVGTPTEHIHVPQSLMTLFKIVQARVEIMLNFDVFYFDVQIVHYSMI